MRRLLMPILILASGCTSPPVQWQGTSGQGAPTLAETSDCRFQARRQAEQLYPYDRSGSRRPPSPAVATAGSDRNASEAASYHQCLEQKGYRLVERR
jgi:hypothetical protein